MFKMALDLAPSDRALCSQPPISRLEPLPDRRASLGIGRALVALYCDSFGTVPKRIVLDIDDTFDAVHGGQQFACSMPIMTNMAGTVRTSVCGRAVDHQAAMALMKRSRKITANWAFAMVHSRGGILHSFSDLFK